VNNPVWNRVQLLFAQGRSLLVSHAKVQARVLDDDIPPNVDRVEPYGFSYRPKAGSEAYVLFPSGDRSFGAAVVIGDKRYVMTLAEGEVAVHDDQGQSVHLTRSGIVVKGAGKPMTFTDTPEIVLDAPLVRATKNFVAAENISDQGGQHSMDGMRITFDGHDHDENDSGGPTAPPNQKMGG
jgi:phage baseplate assembly protein V